MRRLPDGFRRAKGRSRAQPMESLKAYLKEVRTIPLLKAPEEISLANRIKRGDEQARKLMIRSNLRLVINIAKRYMYFGIPLLDLIEEGNLGLMKAVDKFNPKMGFRFSTYAAWWIKQSITRSIADQGKMIRVPIYMNELISKWKKTKETMTHTLGRIPEDDEIAKRMRISVSKKEQILFWLSTSTSSLEAPIDEEGENQVADLIQDQTVAQPDDEIDQMLGRERISGLMGLMTPRERLILSMRFGLKKGKSYTLAEVATKMKVSRERVRQIEEAALRKLREHAHAQESQAWQKEK